MKIKTWARSVVQIVERLPSKLEALSSTAAPNQNTNKQKLKQPKQKTLF
jgi:hypothetical protein